MAIIDKIHESEKKANDKAIATKILDKMKSLRLENDENSSKRWIWELLQNAKDCSFLNQKTSIKINFDKNNKIVEFSHNAQPFTPENLTFLIKQVSTKERGDDKTKTTGKFGTGFLSTHLLSEIVDLESVIYDEESYKKFKLTIDRSGRDIESILNGIEKSFEQLAKIDDIDELNNFNQTCFNTKFTYKLNDQGISIAEQGLVDFKACVFYVLIFIQNIHSITLENENKEFILSENIIELDNNIQKYVIFERTQNSSFAHEIIVAQKDAVSVAMPIIEDQKISFDTSKENPAKLFCDFPLVSTENFPFPAVINCPSFNPTEPRDGIYLTNKDDEEIFENKAIMLEALDLLYRLIEFSSRNNWGKMFVFAQFTKQFEAKWIDTDWLNSQLIEPLIDKLCNTPIVDTMDSQRKTIKTDENSYNVWFPSNDKPKVREMIWDLYSALYPNILPRKEDIHEWYNSLVRDNNKLTVKEAFRDIEDQKDIDQLRKNLIENVNVFEWLNLFFKIVEISKEDGSDNEKFQVYPNQNGVFCVFSDLFKGDTVTEDYKNILKILGKDCNEWLIHKDISYSKIEELNAYSNGDIADEINKLLNDSNSNKDQALLQILILYNNENYKNFGIQNKLLQFWNIIFSSSLKMKKTNEIFEFLLEKAIIGIADILVCYVSEAKNVSGLKNLINYKDEEESVLFLSNFIDCLRDIDYEKYFNRKKNPILPNQNGNFIVKDELFLDDEIDEVLKDLFTIANYDIREELLLTDIYLDMPQNKVRTNQDLANTISNYAKNKYKNKSDGDEETLNFQKKLLFWIEENVSKAKELFEEICKNKYWLYDEVQISKNMRSSERVNHIMQKHNIESLDELEETLERGILQKNKFEIAEDYDEEFLIQSGVYDQEQLNRIIDKNIFADAFIHDSEKSKIKFDFVQEILERSKKNIFEFLKNKKEYELTEVRELDKTIFLVRKNGEYIYLITRPSDYDYVVLYFDSEKDILDYEKDWELWVEDGKGNIQKITFGKMLKLTGINKIPLKKVR